MHVCSIPTSTSESPREHGSYRSRIPALQGLPAVPDIGELKLLGCLIKHRLS